MDKKYNMKTETQITEKIKLVHGNSLVELKAFAENSVDSIVTDPPYEYGFMGKSWDSTGIAYNVELWKECLRVLKPGGYIMAFGSSRTHHRLMVAIEDAGFEIRDTVCWVFGSGFPKSHNIGKKVDEIQGNEREDVGEYQFPDGAIRIKERTHSDRIGQLHGNKHTPLTKGTSEFEGWGTALKPAVEYICMARKPLSEKTVAENCLKWGTGGINIDESRIFTNEKTERNQTGKHDASSFSITKEGFTGGSPLGRFPANLITDGSEEVRECFPETKSGSGIKNPKGGAKSTFRASVQEEGYYSEGDSGNASRFFKSIIYQPKPSKAERNRGCETVFNLFEQSEGVKQDHPTLKPIALMEYLIKMVTPKGGIVLDPFNGSGSTGCAAAKNGFGYIGIDMTAEYIKISEKRIKAYLF